MATWAGAVNGTASSKYRVCIDYIWADNGSGRTYTYNIYCQVTTGNFYGTNVTSNFSGNFTVSGPGVYARTSNRTLNVAYGGTFNPGTFYVQYTEGSHKATVSGSETVPKPTYTVKYDANGGSGAPGNQTKTWGTNLTLSTTTPTKSGYNFLGWATSSTATTATYQPGGTYSTNAAVTLYAVWSLATLVDLNITTKNISVPSTSDGYASLSNIELSYIPITDDTNYNTQFYYKICYVDNPNGDVRNLDTNSESKTYGPFTHKEIGDGGDTTREGFSAIPISANMLLKSIQNTKSETSVKFLVAISSASNSFADDCTIKKIIECPLVNFNFLWIKVIECYRTSSNGLQAKIQVKFPKSYTAMTSYRAPAIRIDNATATITPTSSASKGTDNLITYTLTLTSSQVNTSSHNLKFEISDKIANAIGYSRIGAVGGEDIYIYKDTNICKCTEFIEGDDVKFQKGGRVYANEFIETDSGVSINGVMYFGELIEQ